MAPIEDFATLFQTTLTAQCLNTANTATVTTTAGLPANPRQFRVRLEPAGGSTTQFEIALAQVSSGTVLNFVDPNTGTAPSVNGRGLEGTTAQTWQPGALVTQVVTEGGLVNMGPSGTFTSIQPAGITGSVAASRWVGGTASGAPTTGAHLVGDFVIDQTGRVFICTVAGTPGTWVGASTPVSDRHNISPGADINTSSTNMVEMSSSLRCVVVVPSSGRVLITQSACVYQSTAASDIFIGVQVLGGTWFETGAIAVSPATTDFTIPGNYIFTGLAPGSTTFAMGWRVGSNTANCLAASRGAGSSGTYMMACTQP